MNAQPEVRLPQDRRASIAIDLGAESCRVCLLRWTKDQPSIRLVTRFENAPVRDGQHVRWPLQAILENVEDGIRQCAALAPEGVRSLAVDGWAVDYVRVDEAGHTRAEPFCYRDERTLVAERALHKRITPERLREITGVQQASLNTVNQLVADRLEGLAEARWLNLPEYLLHHWGAEPVAEYTNATHTQMVDLLGQCWSEEIFTAAGQDMGCAPRLVPSGSMLGFLQGPLAQLPALQQVELIAPACHDTASAIAGIPAEGEDWAYISSGTWSLVGTLLQHPRAGYGARHHNFTNLGAVGGATCFHKGINGMWLLKQCMQAWAEQGTAWELTTLLQRAEALTAPAMLLDVEEAELTRTGSMPERLNAQLLRRGGTPLDEAPSNAPAFVSLILHSLADCYADTLRQVQAYTGKQLRRLYVIGGGSRNEFLNRLTAERTGLEVLRGSPESSTLGNFAVQLAALESAYPAASPAFAAEVTAWARRLQHTL